MTIVKFIKRLVWMILGLPLQSAPMSLRTLHRFNRKLPVFIEQHTSRKIFYHLFERAETKFLLETCKTSDVCLDIGANVGYYTALFASKAERVIAVDPIWHNAALLQLAQAINGDKHIQVVQAAVSSVVGQASFLEQQQTSLSGLVNSSSSGSEESPADTRAKEYTVDTITIDSLELEQLDVVKIDIEGGEYEALIGMSNTVQRTQPRLFMMELVDEHLKRAGNSLEAALKLMKDWGYDAKVLSAAGLVSYTRGRPKNDNFIFVRAN